MKKSLESKNVRFNAFVVEWFSYYQNKLVHRQNYKMMNRPNDKKKLILAINMRHILELFTNKFYFSQKKSKENIYF